MCKNHFSKYRSSANTIYEHLRLLKVNDIIKYHQLKIAFDKKLPEEFCQLFTKRNEMNTTNMILASARNDTLVIPNIKTQD